jgi:hypothetical protein
MGAAGEFAFMPSRCVVAAGQLQALFDFMYRCVSRRLQQGGGAPARGVGGSALLQCSDVAFVYPRYRLTTHLSNSLPELVHAKKTVIEMGELAALHDTAGAAAADVTAIKSSLARAKEVFANMGPPGAPLPAFAGTELLAIGAAARAFDRKARTVRRDVAAGDDSLEALRGLAARPEVDLDSFDAACVLVAAASAAHCRLTIGGKAAGAPAASQATAAALLEHVGTVQAAGEALAKRHSGAKATETLRSAYNRLSALSALMTLAATGDTNAALDAVREPVRLTKCDQNDKLLFAALEAELLQRLVGGAWGADSLDEFVVHHFNRAALNCTDKFLPSMKPEGALTMQGGETLRDIYTCVSVSQAHMHLMVPKKDPRDVVFPAGTRYSLSPFLHVPAPAGGPRQEQTWQRLRCDPARARKLAVTSTERALKINRVLFPHDRTNLKAGYLLRAAALAYAEIKDYLYAVGLFNSALKVFELHYGRHSNEVLEVMALQEQFQRMIGSTDEAAAMRKRMDTIRADFPDECDEA